MTYENVEMQMYCRILPVPDFLRVLPTRFAAFYGFFRVYINSTRKKNPHKFCGSLLPCRTLSGGIFSLPPALSLWWAVGPPDLSICPRTQHPRSYSCCPLPCSSHFLCFSLPQSLAGQGDPGRPALAARNPVPPPTLNSEKT